MPSKSKPSTTGEWMKGIIKPDDDKRAKDAARYELHKKRTQYRQAHQAAAARDIGPLPRIRSTKRRESTKRSLRRFCETYFPETFNLGWSPDHLKVIEKMERAVLKGELFAVAMPRGSGKTSLCIAAAQWAILHAHRRYVCLIGSDEPSATSMLECIATDIETNDRLFEDFPEVCWPVRAMNGIHQRANGQTLDGRSTRMEWTARQIVTPSVHYAKGHLRPNSGSIIDVCGITGRIRGRMHKHPSGATLRPDLVLVDDPQTDESAKSPSQVQTRLRTLMGAILGLAGPGRKISGLCAITVIAPNDLADRLLDAKRHPQWQGERTKLLYGMPTNAKLWEQYAKLRIQGMVEGEGLAYATAFYAQHRKAMDKGARPAWEDRFNPDEISAVQHAMNLWYQDRVAFLAEYQNDPAPLIETSEGELTPAMLEHKIGHTKLRTPPLDCTRITAFIDVQEKALYWAVVAWSDSLRGTVIDYGTFPEQPQRYFTLLKLPVTLDDEYPGITMEGQLHQAMGAQVDRLFKAKYHREDGSPMVCERVGIDANWGQSTDTVYEFCRISPHSARLTPCHGRYVGAGNKPMGELPRKPGDRVGLNWRMPARESTGRRSVVRHLLFDTNFWKAWIAKSLRASIGEANAMTVYKGDPGDHAQLWDHLCAEYHTTTQGRGRVVEEWKLRPERNDNHWWDCIIGAAVIASVQGAGPKPASIAKPPGKRISFAERQRELRVQREQAHS